MANSNTSATPVCSFAEHSIYVAPIRFATACPCSGVTGVKPCVRRSSMHVRLFRRSDLSPTRTKGVVGQKCRTSGYHCSRQPMKVIRWELRTLSMTFSSELGQSMAKQTNSRSVSGYERGRRRSYSSCPAVSHNASSTDLPEGLCRV